MKDQSPDWSFFSNSAHVLVCLAEDPHARLRDVADRVGITERSTVRLITQLDEAGILIRVRQGRRNHYLINTERHLRHPLEAHCTIGQMLNMILPSGSVRNLKQELRKHQDSLNEGRVP